MKLSDGRVRELNYRTVRYRGHRNLMAFLLQDLRLAQHREVLKDILERAIPITLQDVVVIFCNVTGWQAGRFVQWSDVRKIYSRALGGRSWSAIQITTAAAVCAALDLHVAGCLPRSGLRQARADRLATVPWQPFWPLLQRPSRSPIQPDGQRTAGRRRH